MAKPKLIAVVEDRELGNGLSCSVWRPVQVPDKELLAICLSKAVGPNGVGEEGFLSRCYCNSKGKESSELIVDIGGLRMELSMKFMA